MSAHRVPSRYGIRRRGFLGAAAAFGAAALGVPPRRAAAADALTVATYGGYFEDSFEKHIYPAFTEATGIEVVSVPEPTSEAWLIQLETAARAGQAPADVSMIAQTAMLKGQKTELWAPLDLARIPNHEALTPELVHRYPDGRVDGLGAVAWYITLVTNTDVYPRAPDSWAAFWDPANADSVGLLALASNSFLLEVTNATFFQDPELFAGEGGIRKLLDKLAEVKPNVALWYRDEGQFQQALQAGEIPMGQYYHDVAGLAAADGHPVRSTFPKEGGVRDSGCWAVSRASRKLDAAHTFIDYMCQPSVQAELARKVGTAPVVKRELTDLSDEEFAAVSSAGAPITPNYQMYNERSDWLNQQWTELVTG